MIEADYVIVGAGSAGSVMTYRLSEDKQVTVVVLEWGGHDWGPLIQMPGALQFPMNMSRYDWGFRTEPEPWLAGRGIATPRGKVIGGSSSINGMVYVRGHADDFDTWEKMGAAGWGYRHVLPYFKRMENAHDGEAGWRGTDGPLHVTRKNDTSDLYRAFIQAGNEAGYGLTEDYNGYRQEGFGLMEQTIWRGRRWSTANAYLRPALKRRNVLKVRGLARKVIFDGNRATGVEYIAGGKVAVIKARREVIIAASAINSPKLLMLSGIGPARQLVSHGIPVLADRPGVGENLQDHLELYIQQECKEPVTLHRYDNMLGKIRIAAQWQFFKSGPGASNYFESCGFIRSKSGIKYPDLEYHFLAAAVKSDGSGAVPFHAFQAHVSPMRSKSRGHIRLKSKNPNDAPTITFNYLAHPDDWEEFRAAIRLTREIFAQPAMARYSGRELLPGANVVTDEQLNLHIRDHVETAYHPCGTCRMGRADDRLAVVDPQCRVIGVEGLRVADSSIFPQETNGNLNAPSIMTGEKASDMILGKDPLPPSNLTPWVHPEWRSSQR